MAYQIVTFPVGTFQCNCSLLFDEQSKEAIVVDPGDDSGEILDRIRGLNLKVRALWHTHAHLDHVGATLPLLEVLGELNVKEGRGSPTVYLHEGDRWLYENVALQSKLLRLHPFAVPKDFVGIKDSQTYDSFTGVRAIHTPGHTPGSCCLNVKGKISIEAADALSDSENCNDLPAVLLSGDTLFKRSIGRTDLWGGDASLIVKSIQKQLYTLSEETVVIPGHGPVTTIEQEKQKNPFVSGE